MKTKVLFVCLGNICRSPTAEGIFKAKISELGLQNRFSHDSAGTSAFHAGERPDLRSTEKAREHGVDLSFIKSRQLIDKDFYNYDYILAMDQSNFDNIMSIRPKDANAEVEMMLDYCKDIADKNVPDPYWSEDDGFEKVFSLLDDAVSNFISQKK